MLVKLTEVCNNGAVTTNKSTHCEKIFVNPEHVVMIREEKRMKELNEAGKVADGLDVNHKFSKILQSIAGRSGTEIIVVGSPEIIEKTLKEKATTMLLRG